MQVKCFTLGVGKIGFIFCGKHPLLVTRIQVSNAGPMGPLFIIDICLQYLKTNQCFTLKWLDKKYVMKT